MSRMNKPLNLSLPPETIASIRAASERQERPISWLVKKAWEIAHDRLDPQGKQKASRP